MSVKPDSLTLERRAEPARLISRSGAGTAFELMALGKASVFLPLVPAAGDEQRKTARRFADMGAARFVDTETATPTRLLEEVQELLANREMREEMERRSRSLAKPTGAQSVAAILVAEADRHGNGSEARLL